MRRRILLSIFLFIGIANISSVEAQCSFDIGDDTGSPQPIFINPGSATFFKPTVVNRKSYIKMDNGDKIELWCSGPWDATFRINTNSINLVCDRNKMIFKVGIHDYREDLKAFKCKEYPATTAHPRSGNTAKCADDGSFIDVGYAVGSRFLILYSVCHNQNQKANRYVHHHIPNQVNARQKGVPRGAFWMETPQYSTMKISALYSIFVQRQTINRILNLNDATNIYVHRDAKSSDGMKNEPDNGDSFLSKGHLAPMADFMFASWQNASCNFLNTAPQWQSFNGFNWEAVETYARSMAKFYSDGLEVYTGTHEILTLPSKSNVQQEIFLRNYPRTPKQVPVPKYYYKILLNRKLRVGIAFIGK